jgi:hypothetical protein
VQRLLFLQKQKTSIAKTHDCKEVSKPGAGAGNIDASTAYDTCRKQLSPFGSLPGWITFSDLIPTQPLVAEQ